MPKETAHDRVKQAVAEANEQKSNASRRPTTLERCRKMIETANDLTIADLDEFGDWLRTLDLTS